MTIYIIFALSDQSGCAQKVSIRRIAVTGAATSSHGRYLPHLVLVLSVSPPTIGSLIASQNLRKKHQRRNRCHTDSKNIRIKDHQKITHKHPAEIAAYISKSIRNLADQRHFSIFKFFSMASPASFALFFLYVDNDFHCCFTVVINVVICFQIILECKCFGDQRS